jgi:hypothetical protein
VCVYVQGEYIVPCLSESESVCQRVCQRWALLDSSPNWDKAEADRAEVYLISFPSVVSFSSVCIAM